MNTMVNTPTRRPSSLFGYIKTKNDRDARVSKENAAREKAELEASLSAEEQKRLALEENMTVAQKFINTLCESIQRSYTAMIDAGKNTQRLLVELENKQKEEDLFYETLDERYKITEIDKTISKRMATRKFVYYLLPILDAVLAFFAIRPIMTSNLFGFDALIGEYGALIAGIIVSLIMGYGLSFIGRGAESSANRNERTNDKLKKYGTMVILPLLYISTEIAFNRGSNCAYTIPMAFISFVIQYTIVKDYSRHIDALEYFQIKKNNEETSVIQHADEQAIQNEKRNIKDTINSIVDDFNQELNVFYEKFRDLANARETYLDMFKKEPKIYLSVMAAYFGNLYVFQDMRIPLSFEPLPTIGGITNTLRSPFEDLKFINQMLNYTGAEINLDQTIQTIKNHVDVLSLPDSNIIENPESIGNKEVEPSASDNSNTNEDKTPNADAPDNSEDDTPNDGGVIW